MFPPANVFQSTLHCTVQIQYQHITAAEGKFITSFTKQSLNRDLKVDECESNLCVMLK